MMRPENAIYCLPRTSSCISVFRGFEVQTKGHSVCGVQIEIVGELWGFPCVTFQNLSLFIVDVSLHRAFGRTSFNLNGCGLS